MGIQAAITAPDRRPAVDAGLAAAYLLLVSLLPCFLAEGRAMLAKLTSKNQLTLPKAAVAAAGGAEYFEVTAEAGRIVLTPVRLARADAVRAKLAELDLSEADVAAAVAWARRAG